MNVTIRLAGKEDRTEGGEAKDTEAADWDMEAVDWGKAVAEGADYS